MRSKSRQSRVYHPQLVAVYHQHEVLYIIKPQIDARWRVMRYKGGLPPLMICTALRAAMICQACGLDKKILVPKNEDFLAGAQGLDIGTELLCLPFGRSKVGSCCRLTAKKPQRGFFLQSAHGHAPACLRKVESPPKI